MIESNYVSELTFASIDSEASLKAAMKKGSESVIKEVTESKLKGCGGAGFPTGLKLSLMAKEIQQPKYIICNADEGEPGTFKDREILTSYPELVFNGMTVSALAIKASHGILYLRAEYTYMKQHLENVLIKLREANRLGKNILGKHGFDFDIIIRSGAGAYVCGEETALIESLEGKRGEPRNRPPFPIQYGFKGKPTQVNNVETLAWISTIMVKGANWFNSVGTEKSAGYKIFSISGDCKRPGVYEFPMGTSVAEVIKEAGGEGAKAAQVGGASGQTVPASDFSRKIAFEDAPPGGSIMIFGPERNMADVAENFLEFFVEESCGQCAPCREGNIKLLEGIRMLKKGEYSEEHLKELMSLCETMKVASKCGLGQTSSNAFLAITKHFSNEIMSGGGK